LGEVKQCKLRRAFAFVGQFRVTFDVHGVGDDVQQLWLVRADGEGTASRTPPHSPHVCTLSDFKGAVEQTTVERTTACLMGRWPT